MEYFVEEKSIVREIWGKSDTILFIFAGASAEFALNKAVDWLYFTGKLPADPLGRLFSTVAYAQKIVFAEKEKAHKIINNITAIHSAVEKNRGSTIPDWAYRDVLFMLIHYSVASFELLERKLSQLDKEEVFNVFYRFGKQMNLRGLPENYNDWLIMHRKHLENDLERSNYSIDLFKQYKKHLGNARYRILVEAQKLVIPEQVRHLLMMNNISLLTPLLVCYKFLRLIKIEGLVKFIILPDNFKNEIKALDITPGYS